MRLIAAQSARAGERTVHRAGIEIKLAPGWHTYWRYPGDAGVPPRFDFAGSVNVKQVNVLWPAPRRYREGELSTIGYVDHLILPLRITPQDGGKPVTLRLKFDYAVCEKLCLPVEARAELAVTGNATAHNDTLAAAEARVPKPAAVGAQAALAIRAVRKEAGDKLPRIVVDVAAPADAKVELFAEGPAPEWALPVPTPIAGAPKGLQRFSFDLDGLPPGAKPAGAALKLTAVSDQAAIEVTTHLD
jgi:DsbC/DsbD-like thiol-disulfide interchange protein